MRHAGEDHLRAHAPYQAKKGEGCGTHATSAHSMNGDRDGQSGGGIARTSYDPEVNLVFSRRQAGGQERGDSLRATSTQVRDQQKDPGPLSHARNTRVMGTEELTRDDAHTSTCTELVQFLRFL